MPDTPPTASRQGFCAPGAEVAPEDQLVCHIVDIVDIQKTSYMYAIGYILLVFDFHD